MAAGYTLMHVIAAALLGFLVGHLQARLQRAWRDFRATKAAVPRLRKSAWLLLLKWTGSAAVAAVLATAVLRH